MGIIKNFHISELVYAQNLTWKNYFEFSDYAFPKRLFQVKRRKNEHNHWIVYIQISLNNERSY